MNKDFTPTYYSIKQDIRDKIAGGIYSPGELLPSRNVMCELYDCSWGTLNRAITELILEGLLTARKGKGTYVSNQEPPRESNPHQAADTLNVWLCNKHRSVYATLSEMMDGMRDEAHRRGVSIRFLDLADLQSIPPGLDEYIIVTPSNDQWNVLVDARNKGERFVVLNSSWEQAPFPCVDSDIYGAVFEAVGYLLKQGHQRIGLLGIRDGFTNYERRVDSFRDAFKQYGVPLENQWIVGRPEDRTEAKVLYSNWLDRNPEVTALFAADYTTTLILLELLQEKGITIPAELSLFIVGTPQHAFVQNGSISAIVQPFHEMGRLAVSRLLERQLDSGTELLPCELKIGDSVVAI
ncbi:MULTISPECIES: GntR family transcriptional regulator [unclassified Paenibacillus]|uniref:GntR family transcriptional regulator n=1 Tax=unclassified Paenibacillus TaxID=185978 RepID=UPI00363D4529